MQRAYTVRRATIEDLSPISSLIHDTDVKWFGNKRTKYEAKKNIFKTYQTHRLVVELGAMETTIIAYAEFRNYPAIGALPSDSWLEWIYQRYCITQSISWLNTLFLNFCIYKKDHPDVIVAILRKLLYIENRSWYLITVRPPDLPQPSYYAESYDDLEKLAKVYYPREFSIGSNTNTQTLYVIERFNLLPVITYRKALAEDNDDFIEMHAYEYPEMRVECGDFYIAEELMRQDKDAKHTHLIVAELENDSKETTTAGFMWLVANVDVRFYMTNYEMETFGNLIKFTNTKPYVYEEINVLSVEPKSDANLFKADAMDDMSALKLPLNESAQGSGISLKNPSDSSSSTSDASGASLRNRLNMCEKLYQKFDYVFRKLFKIDYYISEQKVLINLFYNTDKMKSNKDPVQESSNVFCLKYICVHSEFPLERLFSFMIAMFSAFPNRDYCIMTIPKSAGNLRSHVEALKYFMPVAKRPSEVGNLEDIYITHRSTIFGEISLYRLQRDDVETVQSLAMNTQYLTDNEFLSEKTSFSHASKQNSLTHIDSEAHMIEQIMNDVLENENSEFDIFTIRCGDSTRPAKENTTIGYVILRRFLDHHELHHHYHLPKDDDHLNNERAQIISLKLHPLFTNSSDVIFRNLAGKTNYFDFYFIMDRRKNLLSNDLKTLMMIVEPTPMKKYTFNVTRKERHRRKHILGIPVYDYIYDHLLVFRHKLNPGKWFGNTNKLVIIGFSAESLAFLRQLVFLWNRKDHKYAETYTCLPRLRITVISNPGTAEAEMDCMFRCPTCKKKANCYMHYLNDSCYVRDVVVRMDLRYWVHFVSGTINYVNREKKYVKINKSCEVAYDTLMLMNHKKFSLKRDPSLDAGGIPRNFIEINRRIDKFVLFYKIRLLVAEQRSKFQILVYGSNLHTYECIAFLLTHGVEPTNITLVIPYVNARTDEEQKLKNPYRDENIQYVLEDMLEDLEVSLHRDLTFSHWITHTTPFITQVVFKTFQKQEVTFDCDIFIAFEEGGMTSKTKDWLLKSDIELQGDKILVNENFQTNDPDIYAVGLFIKMNDINLNHQYRYTSARETASKLMHILGLRTYEKPFEYKYTQPTYFQAILPLNYFITKVIMPRRYMASHVNSCLNSTLTTYHDYTFCRIGLSPKMIVDEIVVVTKKDARYDYLEHFCGKHQTMLNNLKQHFKSHSIKCFLCFLQEPWTELLMHEAFDDFQAQNHKMLRPMIHTLEMNKKEYTEQNFREINQHILEQNLLNFVRKHRKDFKHEFALPEDFMPLDTACTVMKKERRN